MSIKRKLTTSLATAGLLAGIFGSALAPVAHAATVKGSVLRDELRSNASGGYGDMAVGTKGTAADPFVIYAPLANDGTATDPIGYTGGGDDPVCMFADEEFFQTSGGAPLHADGDEVPVTVTATNGLGIFLADTEDSPTWSTSEADWTKTGSASIDDVYDGIYLCLAPMDDDDAYTSKVTIKVRGQVAAEFTVVVVGPATSITPVNQIGGWVAEGNAAIDGAALVGFKDKAGQSLSTYGISWEDRVTFAKTGYTSDYETNNVVVYVDDLAIGDAASTMAEVEAGAVNLVEGFCSDMGDSHTLMISVNIDDSTNGYDADTLTSPDLNSGKWTYKCSADGTEAQVENMAFDSTSVVQGDYTTAHIYISDGYGNPQGYGANGDGLDWDCDTLENVDTDNGYSTCAIYTPASFSSGEMAYHSLSSAIAFDLYGLGSADDDQIHYFPVSDGGCDYDVWCGSYDFAFYIIDGNVPLLYRASALSTGIHTVRVNGADVNGTDDVNLRASISVLPAGQYDGPGALFGTTIKIGKRTVSITGPVGAKVMFIVEDAKMNVSTYYRVVGADGKAALRFRKKGFFKVTAVLGDLISNTGYIVPKY